MKLYLTVLIIGLLSGLIGALCGVGGGILMVPAFTLILGMAQKQAVATSLAVIVLTALTSTLNNSIKDPQLIDWKLVALVAVGAIVAAWFGSDLMRSLSSQTLTRIFAFVLIAVGVQMLIKG